MKIYLVSYSTRNYRLSQLLLNISGKIFGVDRCISFTKKLIKKTDFYNSNIHILNQKIGAGFFLWKSYVINEALKAINENDILIYCDAGVIIRRRFKVLIKILISNGGILLFNQNYPNKDWVKRDCFVAFDCDAEEYYNSPQILAGVQLFQKNKESLKFSQNVLENSMKDGLITDAPNKYGKPNLPSFIEHRWDQAVTSLIAHKTNLKLYPDPTQFLSKNIIYQHPNEFKLESRLYKHIFYVHRYKNIQLVKLPYSLIKILYRKIKLNFFK